MLIGHLRGERFFLKTIREGSHGGTKARRGRGGRPESCDRGTGTVGLAGSLARFSNNNHKKTVRVSTPEVPLVPGKWVEVSGVVTMPWDFQEYDWLRLCHFFASAKGNFKSLYFDACSVTPIEPQAELAQGVEASTPSLDRLRAFMVPRASETILLGDGTVPSIPGSAGLNLFKGVMGFVNPANADAVVPEGNGDGGGGNYIAFRHGGKANLIFCDGHVESLRPAQVKQKNFAVRY